MTTSFITNPVALRDLMRECPGGKLQLPDFRFGEDEREAELMEAIGNEVTA